MTRSSWNDFCAKVWILATALYSHEYGLKISSALPSRKWQLIGKS